MRKQDWVAAALRSVFWGAGEGGDQAEDFWAGLT